VRLFVAVWPPADVVARLCELPRPDSRGLRWTTPDQWHVTLRFLGSVGDISGVKAALGRLESHAGATAVAGPAVGRLGRGIVCLPVGGLDGLARSVLNITSGVGERAERSFNGHITLARAKSGLAINPLAGVEFSAAWQVGEITLVESDTRPDGARYQIVASARLG
jgi:RNA 2',3'-cyclic 3'-phosphodiesterase